MKWGLLAAGVLVGCTGGGLPEGLQEAPLGTGPRIVWDLEAEPVAEIPLPNDVATWPDPTSPTGLRLNPSRIMPTKFERTLREKLGELDGWGTYAAITIPFDAPLDVVDLLARQGGSDNFSQEDWPGHAIYLVDLETGVPVPLDLNGGNFQYALARPSQYWDNDPRAGESNIVFETVEEDLNGNGVLDPGEDTDFDGVLDHPNTIDGTLTGDPLETIDRLLWFYERETDTLFLRPILPLDQNKRYAVVITDRLIGEDGESVRSPFEWAHHLSQGEDLEALPQRFRERPHLYGDLAERGWEGVAFAWSFTTQSVTRDLDALRAGLYGDGTFAWLADDMPPDYVPYPMLNPACAGGGQPWVAPADRFLPALEEVFTTAFDLDDEERALILDAYSRLSHVAVVAFDSPYLLGDPDAPDLDESWQINYQTGEGRIGSERITALVFVPKETETHQQPFDASYYVHGHGSSASEGLAFAGYMLQHGFAPVFLNAQGHGIEADILLEAVLRNLFEEHCLGPTTDAMLAGRARDLDGDGDVDSGNNFWTAYTFHTRDVVRQTVLDHVRAIQIMRSFDGTRVPDAQEWELQGLSAPVFFDGDVSGDGAPNLAGDLDGDGTVDVGGPDANYYMSGGSLGGIMTGVMAGLEPAVTAAAPIVGLGGLSDATVRTLNSSVTKAMHLRLMGPAVVISPADPEEGSDCAATDLSLQILSANLTRAHHSEFACIPADLGMEDVVVVENLDNDEVACGGAVREPGHYRVPVPSTAGDRWRVSIYRDAIADVDFAHCSFHASRAADHVIDTFEIAAFYQTLRWAVGEPLVSPTDGLGLTRQGPDIRRLLAFGQMIMDPADPINYARRVFLEPLGTADSPARTRGLFVVNTIGDQNVPLSAGNAYARAAGVLPFLPHDAPDELAPWRAPRSFLGRYDDLQTPNDVLIHYGVLEGLSRLPRHPTPDSDFFLFDVDDFSEGQMRFAQDGSEQDAAGVPAPRLEDPLRWVRQTSSWEDMSDAVWSPSPGEPISALANVYVIPNGIHGFENLVYPVDQFDIAQYTMNMIMRYLQTEGSDLRHFTDPDTHTCLEDSSCDFFER